MKKSEESGKLRQKLLLDHPVPQSYFKYAPVEDWLPAMLTGKSLKFSSRTGFNDPFDSRAAYLIEVHTPAGSNYVKEALGRVRLKPAQRLRLLQEVRNKFKQPRQFFDGQTDEILDQTGILSLATCWKNHLMWSHYANHHKGICIEFSSSVDVFRVALPITYVKELPVILRPSDSTDELLRKALLTKAECWAYEQEWRVIKRAMSASERQTVHTEGLAAGYRPEDAGLLSDHRGVGFYEFDNSAIKSITLGMNCGALAARVLQAANDAHLKIPIYAVDKPGVSYELTRRLIKRGPKLA